MRLVDADALKEIIEKSKDDNDLYCKLCMDATNEIIDEQPTIEAVPVVHAEWKYYRKQGIAVCTNCSFERNVDDNFGRAIACPNCGADMRKKV